MRISEVANRAGIHASAIRYYEDVGILPSPERRHGQRVYTETVFADLALIDTAQRAGCTVAEIRELIHGFPPETTPGDRWRAFATRKLPDVDALIARAQEMKRILEESLACDCGSLQECGATLGRS